jgi:ABC-type Mn2+/Zn2+ transport system ATPase subunit
VTLQPLLTLDNLTVGYEGTPVLGGIHLQIPQGSFTGLLGANGSGKSTLIKTILGIIPPLFGKVNFAKTGAASLGYVPQREVFDPIYMISAFEVVLMGAAGRVGAGKRFGSVEKEFAMACLDQTGARSLSRKRFSQLSGGQKQRVLIARALMTKPELLILDEPTAGIDAAAAAAIMALLQSLHEKQKLTILMVNHDLQTVRKCVHEVIWLHQGKVLHGPVAELLSPQKIEEILSLEIG